MKSREDGKNEDGSDQERELSFLTFFKLVLWDINKSLDISRVENIYRVALNGHPIFI